MAGNPLVNQGTLNRLKASVIIQDFAQLNVTSPYLGKAGISLGLDGESTTFIPTMTGMVTSPLPYMGITLTMNLLRTQNLANLYKLQMEDTALIGDLNVIPDSSALSLYPCFNCAIESVRELSFSGDDAGFIVTIKGYYNINNSMWNPA